jgi:chemosensory pili system protein ChpA (sensor histidine kinase/response regulator)
MESPRILVVDDDPDIVLYLASFLEDHGYELRTASDSRSALAVLEGFHPDAILVDVLMPGRSGLDLLVTLRRDPRWANLPIVVITGSDRILEDDCQSYLGSHEGIRGPDGVLGKPIDPETMLRIVRHLTTPRAPADR